jgi:putative molybdopterin biosynthesis protein
MNIPKKREFLNLITIDEAQKIIFSNFKINLETEMISLEKSKNRILMDDITASMDIPPFDRSLMDGYAVNSEDTYSIDETHPQIFTVIGNIKAGYSSLKSLTQPFTCYEIATGAPIPKGANAVIMVENTSKKSNNEVFLFKPVYPHENIDSAGSDIMFGETILRSGQILSPVKLGILASLGIESVRVQNRIKVGVLSTGDEIRRPGHSLQYGCIYDSNSIILRNLLDDIGVQAIDLGICPDNISELNSVIRSNIDSVDILLLSGGTSAGEGDYSYRVITELGGRLLFHGISSKPGKPLAAGIVFNKLIIALPGFPASAIFSFKTVITPLLINWSRVSSEGLNKISAIVNHKIINSSGRTQFKLVNVIKSGSLFRIYPVKGNSGSVSALEHSDGFITIPEQVSMLSKGESVEVTLFHKFLTVPDITFVGSHDFVIDRLFTFFKSSFPNFNTKLIFVGSSGGLASIGRDECDIAGSHLLDEETNEYNFPFIDKMNITSKVKVIKGYYRIQGLYVAKGNPKKVSSVEDLLRQDLTFMNRIEGSGTRILLDSLLKKLANRIDLPFDLIKKKIKGYNSVASSHSATVNAVSRGIVDVSIGIKTFADMFNIDFIPLSEERYDLIINENSFEKESIKMLLKTFESKEFRIYLTNFVSEVKWIN